ncbi:MAG TPA: chromosome segregation protein SMC [Myxococcaceae bacterium]|nr:chromosome segregation protein SMC [Myxococcaceae bacterium]
MHWVEFALQGVRGFLPSVRVPVRPGYWTLLPQTPGVPLVALASALLYPDGRGEDAALAAPGQAGAKAALWFQARDGATYRVMRDLGRGGALHRVNPTTRAHDLITEDPAELVQYLRGQVGLPARTVHDQLFTFTAAQLPSRRPPKAGRAGTASPAFAPAAFTPEPPIDPAAAAARIAELEKELALSDEVEKLQFRLDGVGRQIDQLEDRLRSVESLEAAVAEARLAFEGAPSPRNLGLPDDVVAQARNHAVLVAKCDEALARLEKDRQLDAATAPPDAVPLTRDGRFWTGLGLGTASLLAGMMASGTWRYVALLDIPAFGLAALVALKHVEDVQWSAYAVRKGERLAEREKKIRDQFELETEPLRTAMKALGVEKPEDLVASVAQREELWNRVLQLEGQLTSAKEAPEYVAESTQLAELKVEQEAVNARLLERGSYVRDPHDIQRELARLREVVSRARAPVAPPTPARPKTPVPVEPLEDPIPGVLQPAADLLALDVPGVVSVLRDRWLQYASALTERRVEQVEVDISGRAFVRGGGRRIAVGELPARDLDWIYLALRLTVVEKSASQQPITVLLEDLAPALDGGRLPLLAKMLKHLGSMTQVLHLTGNAVFTSASDASANV